MLRFKLNEEQTLIHNCISFQELSSERSCNFNMIDAMFKHAIDCYRYPTHKSFKPGIPFKTHIFVWNTKEIVDRAPVAFFSNLFLTSVFKVGLRNLSLTFLFSFL